MPAAGPGDWTRGTVRWCGEGARSPVREDPSSAGREPGSRCRGGMGSSDTVGVSGYAGAEAHGNAHPHATRTDEGNISGWSTGFDGGLFAGA